MPAARGIFLLNGVFSVIQLLVTQSTLKGYIIPTNSLSQQ